MPLESLTVFRDNRFVPMSSATFERLSSVRETILNLGIEVVRTRELPVTPFFNESTQNANRELPVPLAHLNDNDVN